MNYMLEGHTYRHAVEEMLLHLLPANQPQEVASVTGDGCVSTLCEREGIALAAAHACMDGVTHISERAAPVTGLDGLARRRVESELIQLTVYDAVVPFLPEPPVWGSLTGVRPAKLVRRMLETGARPAEAAVKLREHYRVSTARAALTVRAAAIALDIKQGLAPRDVSLYVGIPFCPSRCRYCSFVSADVSKNAALIPPYLDALCEETVMTGQLLAEGGYHVTSVYIGGGTPTTLDARQLARLMGTLQKNIDLSHVREYTVEAGRPDTITSEKLRAIRDGGADRISVNPQTMNQAVLTAIGRNHSAAQVLESMECARQAGFPCINMDVIAGLTGDDPVSFSQTLCQLIALKPENLTVHTLAVKRGANFTDKAANTRCREDVGAMLECASRMLTDAGYAPYYLYRQKFSAGGFENVGWCLQGWESLYNVCMMEELQTIVSLGAGGVSKRVELDTGRITRFANPKYPTEYLQSAERIWQARRQLLCPSI